MDLRKLMLENGVIKLVSFVLSLSLWFYVTSTGKTELTLSVPVELRNVPPGMTVVGDVTGSLEVRLQGQERVLRDGTISKKVAAQIDLSTAKEGENTIPVSPDDIKRPRGTTVSHLSQSEMKVKLDRLVRKTFRVTPVLHGAPAPGYRVAVATVTPSRIAIEGPASVMQSLDRIQTMPIDIQKATGSFTVEPKIDYEGKPVKVMDKNIAVQVKIERVRK
jgi:YbbR domain-containing protein